MTDFLLNLDYTDWALIEFSGMVLLVSVIVWVIKQTEIKDDE